MKHFKINREQIETKKRQVWIRLLLIIVLGAGIELVIKYFHKTNFSAGPVLTTAIIAGILHFIKFHKQIVNSESFILTISDTTIKREQKNIPTIEIGYNDVHEIIRKKDGSIMIRGGTINENIFIPSYIENYGSLEKSLYKIKPFTTKADNSVLIAVSLVLFGIISLYIFGYSDNKILIASSGLIITSMLILFIIKVQQNKNLDKGIRRSRFMAILFAIFIFIVMLARITN